MTVPSFEYILGQNSFYELIPDHLSYFTEGTLSSLMDRCGFDVLKKERVNRDTISVIVRKRTMPDVSGLIARRESIAAEVLRLVDTVSGEGKKIAVWGASHQGFTLCAVTGLQGKVAYIIDSAPFKQGMIAPASHIPIISPEDARKDPADTIIIVAPGYTEEIAGIIRRTFPKGTSIRTLMTDHLDDLGRTE